ncbi:MAG: hypothetical protein ACLGGX_12275 [Bdellovibrionia bacterium]
MSIIFSSVALIAVLKNYKNMNSAEQSCHDCQKSVVATSVMPKAERAFKDIGCQSGYYLAGITSTLEPVCRKFEDKDVFSAVKNSEEKIKPIKNNFVGGWAVYKTCSFNSASGAQIGKCEVENSNSISKCSEDVRPSVLKIDQKKTIFMPSPCLVHGDICFLKSTINSSEERKIFMLCDAYKVNMVVF